MPEETRATGPLRPVELATASVMAGVSVALVVVGWFLPYLGPIAGLAVVPLGFVAHRHRFRALVAATFSASLISFLVAGTGTFSLIVECAVVGGLVGTAKRRAWSVATVVGAVGIIAPTLALVSVGLLSLFATLRKLTLEQIRNTWQGVARVLDVLPGTAGVLHTLNGFVVDALRDWWLTVGVTVVFGTTWFTLFSWLLVGEVLERTSWIRAVDRLDFPPQGGPVQPVPVSLHAVSYRYPGAGSDALEGVSLRIDPGRLVALVGDNGSGKSTLARLLAGRSPTSGRVERPGCAGLGSAGGTALIMQHPESQVLGVRVADDVVWGLRAAQGVDVAPLLAAVGLAGMDDRETSTLSGGELQRLAVAAALARQPRLLISDESTAMVDAAGRETLTALLAGLPAARGMTVVHITHRAEEAAMADLRLRLDGGRLVPDAAARPAAAAQGGGNGRGSVPVGKSLPAERSGNGTGPAPSAAAARLEVRDVWHTYGAGTPWAQPALHGVDLTIEPGEGVLVVGGNGSGKSTLAWILAGVLRPSRGSCLLGGETVAARVGSVGLAFQHARLQLQRARVASDVRAAGAADDEAVKNALAEVGLDVAEIGERRIDELSGGQQRRVALAGILVRRPSVVVLDEPLAGLDPAGQEALVDVLANLRLRDGLTVVVISHDLEGMSRVCDRVVRLDAGRVVSDVEKRIGPC